MCLCSHFCFSSVSLIVKKVGHISQPRIKKQGEGWGGGKQKSLSRILQMLWGWLRLVMGTSGTQVLCWGWMEVTAESLISKVEKASLGSAVVAEDNQWELSGLCFPTREMGRVIESKE